MPRVNKLLRQALKALGLLAVLMFPLDFIILASLRPLLVNFAPLPHFLERLLVVVGIHFLVYSILLVLFLIKLFSWTRSSETFNWKFPLYLLSSLTGLALVAGNIALLGDIGNQYEHHLPQPEWVVLYLVLAVQMIIGLIVNVVVWRERMDRSLVIQLDSKGFFLTHVAGMFCGLAGLFLTFLRFFFNTPLWMVEIHQHFLIYYLVGLYFLVTLSWLGSSFLRGSGRLLDERQRRDFCRSALLTLTGSLIVMSVIYHLSLGQLGGLLNVLWFSLLIFLNLFFFSLFNTLFYLCGERLG